MKIDRRSLLKLLLASAVAEAVDVEKLLWTPKPIITVPAIPGTYGAIDRATYTFWRDQCYTLGRVTNGRGLFDVKGLKEYILEKTETL